MIAFTKMQGIGNDFVMVDLISSPLPSEGEGSGVRAGLPELAKKVNDRRFGIGGDGLILLEKGEQAPFKMRMFNPDGSESEMCGNGIRCFAVLLKDHGHIDSDTVDVETGAGVLKLNLVGEDSVRVDMGPARLTRGEIPMMGTADEQFVEQPVGEGFMGTAVSMGNPHLVIFVNDVSKIDLELLGPRFENDALFPRRTNVHFVQVVDRATLIQRTWERGAGATLACGTGACSVGVAGFLTGRTDRSVEVRLPGGSLHIEYLEDGRVLMTGPAKTVFTGELPE
ncbi:MAG TPA: diaminopimelate epimerase [Fimbriimonas sp.]|nr:diaminopimelate epimerase [Fimbriimonas sp.]